MRWLVLVGLVGCSFVPGTVPGTTGDGSVTGDGRVIGDDGGTDNTGTVRYVQGAVVTNFGGFSSVSAAFAQPQVQGHFNVIVVSWSDGLDQVSSVVDDQGNTYTSAVGVSSAYSQSIYYAPNIRAGTNTVTVTLSAKVPDPKLRVFEYAGLASASPVDRSSTSSSSGTNVKTGPITTTNAHDLLFSANVVGTVTTGPGEGYTQRQLDNGDLVQDRVVTAAGMYSATATLTNPADWVMQLVAFKAAE